MRDQFPLMIQSCKKKHELAKNYDAILIGSGMGCMATAACLTKEGKKVLVLERHYTAGGYTHVFKRKGYEWDVGIHYTGKARKEKSTLRRMFDYIAEGVQRWSDMSTVYDRIVITIRHFMNYERGELYEIDQSPERYNQ